MPILKDLLTPVALLSMAGVMLYDHLTPRVAPAPEPTVSGVSLGRAYAPVLVAGYADAWVVAAKTLEEGKSVADAQKALQDSWKEARVKAFKQDVLPGFSLVLPEGTEPTDAAKRSQVADLWRAFAKGLKGAH
ncbi:MAG: hypothetical protein LC745_07220 [Planctomycetia bacterium]|nr:hypothetical protein [Planctomycetia bacterium]